MFFEKINNFYKISRNLSNFHNKFPTLPSAKRCCLCVYARGSQDELLFPRPRVNFHGQLSSSPVTRQAPQVRLLPSTWHTKRLSARVSMKPTLRRTENLSRKRYDRVGACECWRWISWPRFLQILATRQALKSQKWWQQVHNSTSLRNLINWELETPNHAFNRQPQADNNFW